MRFILWILFLFAAAVGAALLAQFNSGNVTFFVPPYRVDLSLNFFIILIVISFAILYAILRIARHVAAIPKRVAEYRKKRFEEGANQALRESITLLYEGHFVQAEKRAEKAAEFQDNVNIASLIGARAAHALQEFERRDNWLARISGDKKAKNMRLMSSLELFVDNHQTKEALQIFSELTKSGSRSVQAQRFALKAYQQAQNWEEVLRISQSLDKHHAIHPALAARLREMAYEDLIDSANNMEVLKDVWKKVPKEERLRTKIAEKAARAFHKYKRDNDAVKIIADSMEEEWDDKLLSMIRDTDSEAGSPELRAQIELCEKWIKQRPEDAELALTLGVLCLKEKLWGQAKRYLDRALIRSTSPHVIRETHLSLAVLNEILEDSDEAAFHYRQSALVKTS